MLRLANRRVPRFAAECRRRRSLSGVLMEALLCLCLAGAVLHAQAVGLQRVCQAAVEQFMEIKFETPLKQEMERQKLNQSVSKVWTKEGLFCFS